MTSVRYIYLKKQYIYYLLLGMNGKFFITQPYSCQGSVSFVACLAKHILMSEYPSFIFRKTVKSCSIKKILHQCLRKENDWPLNTFNTIN